MEDILPIIAGWCFRTIEVVNIKRVCRRFNSAIIQESLLVEHFVDRLRTQAQSRWLSVLHDYTWSYGKRCHLPVVSLIVSRMRSRDDPDTWKDSFGYVIATAVPKCPVPVVDFLVAQKEFSRDWLPHSLRWAVETGRLSAVRQVLSYGPIAAMGWTEVLELLHNQGHRVNTMRAWAGAYENKQFEVLDFLVSLPRW